MSAAEGPDPPTESDFAPAEVLIEIRRIGNVARVCAIDPMTNTEVVIVGDPRRGEAALKRAAVRKLAYILRKRRQSREGGGGVIA